MIKLLHIEDDFLDHELTKTKLLEQNSDYEIHLAQTVPEAMELLEKNSYNCILSDYHFPRMNGIELLRAIRDKGYDYPFIFFTGQGNEEVAAEALREGADDYFTKELYFAIYERLSRSIVRVVKAHEDRKKRVEAEKELETLFNISLDIFCVADYSGNFKVISPAIQRILGWTVDDMLAKPWLEIVHPEDQKDTVDFLDKLKEGKQVSLFENRNKSRSGQYKWISWNATPDKSSGLIYATARDVTDKKKILATLQSERDKAQKYLNIAGSIIVVLDIQGNVSLINKRGCEILDLDDKDITSKNWFDNFVPREVRDDVKEVFGRIVSGDLEPIEHYENEVLCSTGDRRLVAWHNNYFRDEKGKIIGTISSGEDITEHRKAEEALKISEEKFFKAFHSSPQMILLSKYQNGEVLEVNDAFLKGFKYNRDEILGKTRDSLNLLEKSHQAKALDIWDEKGSIRNFEAPFFTKTGNMGIGLFSGEMIEIEGEKCLLQVISDVTDVKKAEEELRVKAQIIDQIHESVVTTDMNGHVINWNRGAERQFGYTEEEALGKHVSFIYAEEDHELLENEVLKPLKEKGSHEKEVRILKKSGEFLYAHLLLSLLRDENEIPVGMIGYAIDITERKKAQDALKESEEHYRIMFEHSPTPMQEQDWSAGLEMLERLREQDIEDIVAHVRENPEEGKMLLSSISILRSNEAYLELYSAKNDDFVRENVASTIPDNGVNVLTETISAVLAGKSTFQVESTSRTFDGRMIDVDIKWSVVPGHESSYSKVLLSIIDITERKKAERALRQSEARFKSLYRNTPVMLQTSDPDGRLTEVSNLLLEKFGYERDEVIGSYIYDYLSDDSRKYYLEIIREMLFNEGFILDVPLQVITKTGETIHALVSAFVEMDEVGNPLRSLSVIVDITEKMKMEEEAKIKQQQLIQADKMASLGILVSGVAHEINNPNNYILLGAQALADAWKSAVPILDSHYEQDGEFYLGGLAYSKMRDKLSKLTSGIINSAVRIKDLVKSLKDFARQDSSDLNHDVDINKALENAVTLVENKIKKSTNVFNIEYAREIPIIVGNQNRIEQVIINLLQNSCDALTDVAQAISVRTYFDEEKNCSVVEVTDEGRGIPEKMLKHVLDPFFTTKRDSGGTGLGLSVSAGIIEDHGGKLEISSKLGDGTTAMIQLPIKD